MFRRRAWMLIAAAAVASACSSGSDGNDAEDTSMLSGRPSVAFTTRSVRVCWEGVTGFTAERDLVRGAVAATWESVAGANLQFVGWDDCNGVEPDAVHVEVARARPYVHAFAKNLLGKSRGVTLNFTYGAEFGQGCAVDDKTRRSCIVVDAVHEFGHVLGFSHEQNRADRPNAAACTADQLAAGRDDPTTVAETTFDTEYDPSSVMNYCNPVYWDRHLPQYAVFDATHPWSLSAADAAGMRAMYGGLPPPGCPAGDGFYCGGSTLYQCTAGAIAISQLCANGCQQEPAGTPDRCR